MSCVVHTVIIRLLTRDDFPAGKVICADGVSRELFHRDLSGHLE